MPLFTGSPLSMSKCQLSCHLHHHLLWWHQGLEVQQDVLWCPAMGQHLCSQWWNHQRLLNTRGLQVRGTLLSTASLSNLAQRKKVSSHSTTHSAAMERGSTALPRQGGSSILIWMQEILSETPEFIWLGCNSRLKLLWILQHRASSVDA